MTASIGVAVVTCDHEDPNSPELAPARLAADRALYDAKRAGRSTVGAYRV
jgi:GGDEF domain-containing protein